MEKSSTYSRQPTALTQYQPSSLFFQYHHCGHGHTARADDLSQHNSSCDGAFPLPRRHSARIFLSSLSTTETFCWFAQPSRFAYLKPVHSGESATYTPYRLTRWVGSINICMLNTSDSLTTPNFQRVRTNVCWVSLANFYIHHIRFCQCIFVLYG